MFRIIFENIFSHYLIESRNFVKIISLLIEIIFDEMLNRYY